MFGRLKGELGPPPGAKSDPRSLELARVWSANGEQHVVLRADAWGPDAAPWGVMIVDLARHIARAHSQMYGKSEADSLLRIRELWDLEWNNPTDRPRGGLQSV